MKNGYFILLFALLFGTQAMAQQPAIQYARSWDKDGINVFEPSKKAEQPEYTGFKLRIGGSFTQDFQSLTHSNNPVYAKVSATNATNKNLLYGVIKTEDSTSVTLRGFNLAMANLNFDIQIGDGVRVALENYMSARHHNEFWVKGGYIQFDKLPMFGNPKWYSDYMRVKIGHFQPNYGDMQFRRSDGGNTMFNPFCENLILDAFATEIGGELYVFPADGFMGMVGMSSGFINGNIEKYPDAVNSSGVVPTKKTPSIFAKVAYDKTFNDLRFRLSASLYNNPNIQRNTLYAGDRTGSHYFMVMEPALQSTGVASTATAQFTSGRFNPNVSNRVTAIMFNPFVKYKGLEVFGTYEIMQGAVYADVTDGRWNNRKFNQLAVEGLYRFLKNEQAYVGARYITMSGEPGGTILNTDGSYATITISRTALVAGWFPTKNMLLKGEYVFQQYNDFPTADYRNGGKFNGFMVEAVIGF